jgi:BirA family biotin operon repressor/biotin-[acetyl-CoA-carboxylase] ligase
VSSAAGSGYRLDSTPDLLAAEAVLPLLSTSPTHLGLPYRYVSTTASTNTLAREEGSAGSPHGTVVVTDYQHTGRGRLGRSWVSEEGKDLTFSLVIRPHLPPERASRITLATSVAVAETLSGLDGLDGRVSIKWPNDVLVDGRKVCGILSEASLDMDTLHWVVVGIGLNVNSRPARAVDAAALPPGSIPPISLCEAGGKTWARAPLLVELLSRLDRVFSSVGDRGWEGIIRAFTGMDALVGRSVEVVSGGAESRVIAAGVAQGVGPEGELLVAHAAGDVRSVLSGDVTLRRSDT